MNVIAYLFMLALTHHTLTEVKVNIALELGAPDYTGCSGFGICSMRRSTSWQPGTGSPGTIHYDKSLGLMVMEVMQFDPFRTDYRLCGQSFYMPQEFEMPREISESIGLRGAAIIRRGEHSMSQRQGSVRIFFKLI